MLYQTYRLEWKAIQWLQFFKYFDEYKVSVEHINVQYKYEILEFYLQSR